MPNPRTPFTPADSAARDLIKRLADVLTALVEEYPGYCELLWEVRAWLAAQPKPAARPTSGDVTELFYKHVFVGNGEASEVGFEDAIAEALTRWGYQPPPPEPDV